MADVNRVILIGRLTRDAELKYTSGGIAVCKFAIAVGKLVKKGDSYENETSFFDVVAWGKTGESLNQYLVKGKQVAVEGELHQNRWEQDGQARSKIEINANNIQLLGSKEAHSPTKQYSAPSKQSSARNDAPPEFEDDFPDSVPF